MLDGLIAEALANNKNVKIAAANVEQAAAVLRQARSPLYPQVGAGASGSEARGSESGAVPLPAVVPNPQTSYELVGGVELGDRPVGPHPAPDRGGAGQRCWPPRRPGAA